MLCIKTNYAQSGSWVWIKGEEAGYSSGSYGRKGVEDVKNEPAGRYHAAYWKDLEGNFWLYGGVYNLNDLWKYNPKNNNWTWIKGSAAEVGTFGTKGVPSIYNNPPALGYGALSWVDYNGDLWLFSGNSIATYNADLIWRYHIATNEWTWISGSAGIDTPRYGIKGIPSINNTPGFRAECRSTWVYNNKLWFFGGADYKLKLRNDLWSFDLSNYKWTWESGTDKPNDTGNFGIKGIPNITNAPPSRYSYSNWQDADSNFYLFGGGNASTIGYNDVWKYELKTKLWTWLSGTSKIDTNTVNVYCEPNSSFYPTSRYENRTVQTNSVCTKAYWTFGGADTANTSSPLKVYNDLWLFNISNLQWTKVKGGTNSKYYGIKGVENTLNMPPGKLGSCLWTDEEGLVYIFGGFTYFEESLTSGGAKIRQTNDMWKFIPDTACIHTGIIRNVKLKIPKDTIICWGDSIKLPLPKEYDLKISPITGSYTDTLFNTITFFDTVKFTIIANPKNTMDPCLIIDTFQFNLKKHPKPKANFTPSPTIAYLDNPVFSLYNSSENSINYEWYYKGSLISTVSDILQKYPEVGMHCITLVATNFCNEKDTITKCVEVINRVITNNNYEIFNQDIGLTDKPIILDSLVISDTAKSDTVKTDFNKNIGRVSVPSAFTPNRDGKNDGFRAILTGPYLSYSMIIMNRYGEEIFSTNDAKQYWDGKFKNQDQMLGVYYYLIKVKFDYPNAVEEMYKGDVTLLR